MVIGNGTQIRGLASKLLGKHLGEQLVLLIGVSKFVIILSLLGSQSFFGNTATIFY
jgi:hypothetical protein